MSNDQHPTRFAGHIAASVGLLLLLSAVFILHALAERRIHTAYELRLRSSLLATELRQSSDDLTRMVRTYVVTGKPVYKQHYQDILDIRNGDKARPADYETITWDRLSPAGRLPSADSGQRVALLELMRRAGFVPGEFRKLEEAKGHSDALSGLEFAAMRLVESGIGDVAAKRHKALMMLMDETYLLAKDSIMKPIDEFGAMLDARTLAAVQAAKRTATALQYLFMMVGLGLVFMLWRTYAALNDTLGGSVDEVGAEIARIGRGDFSASIQPRRGAENSVLGWLSATQVRLNERARERSEAEEVRSRLVAIVHSSDDAIISKTTEGVITSWNRAAERIFGYAAEEAIGRPARILFPAERGEEEAEILARIRRGETTGHFETVRVRKDGQLIDVSVTVSPLRDDSGKIIGASMIARDITAQRRNEEELRQSEERYRSLVTATSQIVWHTNPQGQVSGPLPTWQAYTGQGEAEIQGAGWAAAVHPDDSARTLEVWGRAVASKSLYDVEYRVRRHDGTYRCCVARGVPVLNDNGAIREWVGTCTDIHDRKLGEDALRESEERLNIALSSSGVGTWSWNIVENSIFWDDHLHPLFGLKPRTFPGHYEAFLNLVHPGDRERITQEVAASVEKEAPYDTQYRVVWPNGALRWLASRGKVYRDLAGQPLRMTGVCWDVTERKDAEEEISKLNNELEQRVIERTAQLAAANKELEAFSYSVSHDLRAPLRGIDSFSRMVIEDYGPKLDTEGQRQLNVIRSEAQRMGQLIDELLDFSRLGRQEVRSAHFEMNALVQSVFNELPASARERVRQFTVHPLPNAYGDRAMIRQVLVNLIGNAVKFSSTVADPVIEISGDTVDGSTTYRVKDNGVGFDPRYAHKLFGVFQRLHAEHEFEGTGVGLAIVQRVIHRHGGNVAAVGVPDHGATFSFTLPAQSEPGKDK